MHFYLVKFLKVSFYIFQGSIHIRYLILHTNGKITKKALGGKKYEKSGKKEKKEKREQLKRKGEK
jgi:hypothetical protein